MVGFHLVRHGLELTMMTTSPHTLRTRCTPAAVLGALPVLGTTSASNGLWAINWVVDHHSTDGLNVRVVNLSLGDLTKEKYNKSLLAAGVERAWQAGIVVVVAAGNEGPRTSQLNSPADDPYV